MPFVIKAIISNSTGAAQSAWVKLAPGTYRIGPRSDAAMFIDEGAAKVVIAHMPDVFRNSGIRFSIEPADGEPERIVG